MNGLESIWRKDRAIIHMSKQYLNLTKGGVYHGKIDHFNI